MRGGRGVDRNTKPVLLEQIPLEQTLQELESRFQDSQEVRATPGTLGHHDLGVQLSPWRGERLTLASQTWV